MKNAEENGKQKAGNRKCKMKNDLHLPVSRFLFPVSCFPFSFLLAN